MNFTERNVNTSQDIKDVSELAEKQGAQLYAGITPDGRRFGFKTGNHFALTAHNGILYNDKLFAATSHYSESDTTPETESADAAVVPEQTQADNENVKADTAAEGEKAAENAHDETAAPIVEQPTECAEQSGYSDKEPCQDYDLLKKQYDEILIRLNAEKEQVSILRTEYNILKNENDTYLRVIGNPIELVKFYAEHHGLIISVCINSSAPKASETPQE